MSTKLNREIVFFFLTVVVSVGTVFAGQASPDNVWKQVDSSELQQRVLTRCRCRPGTKPSP
jgi:hypothetical protein